MAPSSNRDANGLTSAEYVTLVMLLACALIGTALLVGWLAERQGLVAPNTRQPDPGVPADDGTEPGYPDPAAYYGD